MAGILSDVPRSVTLPSSGVLFSWGVVMGGLFDQCGETEERSQYGRVAARARSADGAPSHEAAEQMNESGAVRGHALAVMRLVESFPGSTAWELFHAQGDASLDRVEIGRRLDSLVKAGRVRQGEPRACRVKGTSMTTWWAV